MKIVGWAAAKTGATVCEALRMVRKSRLKGGGRRDCLPHY